MCSRFTNAPKPLCREDARQGFLYMYPGTVPQGSSGSPDFSGAPALPFLLCLRLPEATSALSCLEVHQAGRGTTPDASRGESDEQPSSPGRGLLLENPFPSYLRHAPRLRVMPCLQFQDAASHQARTPTVLPRLEFEVVIQSRVLAVSALRAAENRITACQGLDLSRIAIPEVRVRTYKLPLSRFAACPSLPIKPVHSGPALVDPHG